MLTRALPPYFFALVCSLLGGHLVARASALKGQESSPKEVQSATQKKISRRLYAFLLKRVFTAPKMVYRLHSFDIYKNGIWAEYSITNYHSKTKMLAAQKLVYPVASLFGKDSKGREWRFSNRDVHVSYANPSTFYRMHPGATFTFRTGIPLGIYKPLAPIKPLKKGKRPQPKELEYLIFRWWDAYTVLSEEKTESINIFILGYGSRPFVTLGVISSLWFPSSSTFFKDA